MSAKTIFFLLLAVSILSDGTRDYEDKLDIKVSYVEVDKSKILNFIKSYNKRISDEVATEIANNIIKYSTQYNVDPKLITALIARESSFNPKSISSSGAMGLGQLMPKTAKEVGVSDPYNIEQNVRGTIQYLRKLMNMFENYPNRVDLALASYRIGHRVVRQYNDIPPIPEVKDYVKDVRDIYLRIW